MEVALWNSVTAFFFLHADANIGSYIFCYVQYAEVDIGVEGAIVVAGNVVTVAVIRNNEKFDFGGGVGELVVDCHGVKGFFFDGAASSACYDEG